MEAVIMNKIMLPAKARMADGKTWRKYLINVDRIIDAMQHDDYWVVEIKGSSTTYIVSSSDMEKVTL